MEDPTAAYSAVYHFRDDHLLSRFIETIPRTHLLEYVRTNESTSFRRFC